MTQDGAGGIVRNPSTNAREPRIVALTGARTFLGKHLLGLLEEDETVGRLVVIDGEAPVHAGPKTRSYPIDRTEPNAAARIAEILAAESVDTFVHLGFLENPTRNTAWAHELESVGTLHVLHACRERPVQKLILGSATSLYGPHYDNPNFLDEAHPLRGLRGLSFFADKIDAERQVRAFAADMKDVCVTVLRFAPLLGPTVESYVTRWLSRKMVPTLLGFDPLLQFVHEVDALAALKLALAEDAPGVFNIVAEGVLPVSTVVKLAGRSSCRCRISGPARDRASVVRGPVRGAGTHAALSAPPVRGRWRLRQRRARHRTGLHHARGRARVRCQPAPARGAPAHARLTHESAEQAQAPVRDVLLARPSA